MFSLNNNLSKVNSDTPDKTILVPLTNSLYVPGKLADTEHVIVDIGTGYYVKKVRRLHSFSSSDIPDRTTDSSASP